MSERSGRRGFASRPSNPDPWIKAIDGQPGSVTDAPPFSARLTIDITPELRGQIKISAFRRGVTVADMLRELLAREFSEPEGDTP